MIVVFVGPTELVRILMGYGRDWGKTGELACRWKAMVSNSWNGGMRLKLTSLSHVSWLFNRLTWGARYREVRVGCFLAWQQGEEGDSEGVDNFFNCPSGFTWSSMYQGSSHAKGSIVASGWRWVNETRSIDRWYLHNWPIRSSTRHMEATLLGNGLQWYPPA